MASNPLNVAEADPDEGWSLPAWTYSDPNISRSRCAA